MIFFKKTYLLLILLISCESLKNTELYSLVEENENSVFSFRHKDIFIDSKVNDVWGVKINDCKSILFDSINNFTGSDHLHIKWKEDKECKFLGFGFSWGNYESKNLQPIINDAAIEFRIRTDSGSINNVPMFFSLVDYSEKQCFSKINLLDVEGQVIDKNWRKVIIPLSTFKYQKKGVNISNIKELRIQLQRKGDVHIDALKIVPHFHNYRNIQSNFSKSFISFPIRLGEEKKYWWGVNNKYSDNFTFITNSSSQNSQVIKKDSLNVDSLLEDSKFLSVNYNKNLDEIKWNDFGFPINNWEYADLSTIYTSSAIYFRIKGPKVPLIQIDLSSYKGKIKRISKTIGENNIINLEEDLYSVYLPIKSFNNYESLDWSKIKDIRFRFLESANIDLGDFKIVEFRGNPKYPNKWRGI